MLEVRDLSVPLVNARSGLAHVNLTIAAGEMVALSGEPAAGKTTLVRCIAGELQPTAGVIEVDGRPVWGPRRAANVTDVAVVWQDLALAETLDVAANLLLGREANMRSDSRFYAAATRELRELGIPIADVTVPVASLSVGQRWLLALAMALGRKPKLLIVDELTASLGVLETATVERLLTAAKDNGAAVLLVTRDIEQMFRVADRVVVLAHGGVAAELDPVTSHRDDIAAMLGEEAAIAHREAAALRRSQEFQRQFLSRLSHELRTPLTAIRGYATSLAAPDVTWDAASQQRFLERIAAESARLGRLVDDLLDFSAIESGVMRLQPDWCDLNLVIKAAVALLPDDWSGAVRVCCDVDVPAVWADHDRLEQVFVNLLVNAFKHNGDGTHVSILGHQTDANTVEISVSDDGDGFPPDMRSDPFDSALRPHSRTAGAGLGLNIARGIVQAHGGTIELLDGPAADFTVGADRPQTGTEFRITLPVETAGAERSVPEPPPPKSVQPVTRMPARA